MMMTAIEPHQQTCQVTLTVRGYLDKEWADWLDGLQIAHNRDGSSTLTGFVIDQAALHGLLTKMNNLGLTLLALDWRRK